MLLKLLVPMVVGFSTIGFAAENNARPDDAITDSSLQVVPSTESDGEKGTTYLNTWLVVQEGGQTGAAIPGNVYVEKVDFQRTDTFQSLYANIWIGQCSGDWGPCRRSFSFSMQCRDDFGNTRVINSPYFPNYSTNGYEYRNFSFTQADVVWCSFVDNIWLNWRYGW